MFSGHLPPNDSIASFCIFWTLKSEIAKIICQGGIKPEEFQSVCAAVPEGREDPSPLVAKRTGDLSPGAVLKKSPAGDAEQEAACCSLEIKYHFSGLKIIIIK